MISLLIQRDQRDKPIFKKMILYYKVGKSVSKIPLRPSKYEKKRKEKLRRSQYYSLIFNDKKISKCCNLIG